MNTRRMSLNGGGSSLALHLKVALAFALLLQAVWASPAGARQWRFAVIVDESIGGKPAGVGLAQGELERGLQEKGQVVVDRARVTAARRDAAVELLLKGDVPQTLTALDAELLLVGQVGTSMLGNFMDSDWKVCSAAIKASLIRVSTGEVIKTFTGHSRGSHVSAETASQRARRAAGRWLLDELLKALPGIEAHAEPIALVVRDLPGPGKLQELAQALRAVEGISEVTTGGLSRRMSRLRLQSRLEALDLALRLERAGLPIEVMAATHGRILARWAPERALLLKLLLLPAAAGGRSPNWLRSAVSGMLQAEFENVTYLDVRPGGVALSVRRPRPGDIKRLVAGKEVDLVAVPRIMRAGRGLVLETTLYDAATGARMCAATASGRTEEVADLVGRLVRKLETRLLKNVSRRGRLPAGLARRRRHGQGLLRIDAVRLDDIFPARLGYYTDHPLGVVKLSWHGKQRPRQLKVSLFIPGFMKLASEQVITPPAGKDRFQVPLTATLDRGRVFVVEENTPAQARVRVSFQGADGVVQRQRVVPVMVFDKNALSWNRPASLAAFVTPREKNLMRFARQVTSVKRPRGLAAGVADAVALFEAMRLLGVHYVKDPANPYRRDTLDYVQYPRETLALRGGDCDDLAVLYAAMLESVGIETALITTPEHVLMAFRLDSSRTPAHRLVPDPSLYLTLAGSSPGRRGKLRGTAFRVDGRCDRVMLVGQAEAGSHWIPVETTALEGTFTEAWRQGAREIARWRRNPGRLGVVLVRQAWAGFPPAVLPAREEKISPDGARLERALAAASGEIRELAENSLKRRMVRLRARMAKNPRDTGAATEAAKLLGRAGKVAEARHLLEPLLKKHPRDAALANDLANLLLLSGESEQAFVLYRKAARGSRKLAARVFGNVALARMALGDEAGAERALAESVRRGGEKLFAGLGAQEGVEAKPPATKPGPKTVPGQLDRRRLRLLIERVLEHAAKTPRGQKKVPAGLFSNPFPSGGRRGIDPRQQSLLADLLLWSR